MTSEVTSEANRTASDLIHPASHASPVGIPTAALCLWCVDCVTWTVRRSSRRLEAARRSYNGRALVARSICYFAHARCVRFRRFSNFQRFRSGGPARTACPAKRRVRSLGAARRYGRLRGSLIGMSDDSVRNQPVRGVTETGINLPCGLSHGSRIVCHSPVNLD